MKKNRSEKLFVSALVLVVAGLMILFPPNREKTSGPALSAAQKQAVEAVVRDYLKAHPEAISNAMRDSLARQQQDEKDKQRLNIKALSRELLDDPGAFVGGNPAGDIAIVEFFDYNCPYCKKTSKDVLDVIRGDGGIRMVYKEYPILGEGSIFAAKAALAARAQNRYEEIHDAFMAFKGRLDESAVLKLAGEIGLDMDRLKRDIADPATESILLRNHDLADALGIDGTPAYVINNDLVPGAIGGQDMKKLIAAARAQK